MNFRLILAGIALALVPTLAQAQTGPEKRQRTPEQEARREVRHAACREEVGKMHSGMRKARTVMRQQVRDCMRRHKRSRKSAGAQ